MNSTTITKTLPKIVEVPTTDLRVVLASLGFGVGMGILFALLIPRRARE